MTNIINFNSNSIIDIGVMQTIANAINKHDDALNALTNNMSYATPPLTDTNLYASAFDFASNAIQWGHLRVNMTKGTSVGPSKTTEVTVSFPSSFNGSPIVVATAKYSGVVPAAVAVVTVGATTSNNFKIRVDVTNDSTPGDGTVDVNWIAIGLHG